MAMIGTSGFPFPAMPGAYPPRRAAMSGGLDEYLPMTQIAPGASPFGDSFMPIMPMSGGFSPQQPSGLSSRSFGPSAWGAGASLSAAGFPGMRAANPFAANPFNMAGNMAGNMVGNMSGGYPSGMASAYRTAAAFPVGGYGAGGASPFYAYGRGGPMGGMMGPARSWGDNSALGGHYPMNSAQRTGKKVGDLVTALLEENPGLQEKLENLNLDALKENIGPALERYRASVQQAIKPVPRWVDHKVIQLLDTAQARDLATQFDTWLRKPPSPMVLSDLRRQKMQRSYADNPYGGDYGGGGGGGFSDMEEEAPQKSWLKRMTSKVSRFLPGGKKDAYSPGRSSGFSDADLEALLSSSMDSRRPYRSRYSDDY